MPSVILIRGGGDLATGVALRLIRSGLRVVVTEIAQPLAVRRTVSFAEAVYAGEITVEGVPAHRIPDPTDSFRILMVLGKQQIPVLVDPDCTSAKALHASVIVDARMTKRPPEPIGYVPQLYLGLGPGFEAGVNCQAVVETRRGAMLGRVYWQRRPGPGYRPAGWRSAARPARPGRWYLYRSQTDRRSLRKRRVDRRNPILNRKSSIENSQPFPGSSARPAAFGPDRARVA